MIVSTSSLATPESGMNVVAKTISRFIVDYFHPPQLMSASNTVHLSYTGSFCGVSRGAEFRTTLNLGGISAMNSYSAVAVARAAKRNSSSRRACLI
jgi:hypothetical protein